MRTKKTSKKNNNIIMLGGESFKKNTRLYYNDYFKDSFKSLNECYNSWSDRKEYIFNHYYNMLVNEKRVNILKYGVRSFNSNIIVLGAIIKKNNKKYYLMITPTYNYFNEIIGE